MIVVRSLRRLGGHVRQFERRLRERNLAQVDGLDGNDRQHGHADAHPQHRLATVGSDRDAAAKQCERKQR